MPDSTAPSRNFTSERAAYARDGAVILKGVLDLDWVERMRAAVAEILDHPGAAAVEYAPSGSRGRYLGDFLMWTHQGDFRDFALASPLPAIAQQILQSDVVRFFYDQLLVKEPNTLEETPWHQDLPYWPLRGEDILSLWVPFDPVSANSGAMRYVKGSHRSGALYAPTPFSSSSGFSAVLAARDLPRFPAPESFLPEADILVCEMEPGDVIAHHPLVFHWSPGNLDPRQRRRALALRYLGDDARFDEDAANFLDHPRLKPLLPEPLQFRTGDRPTGCNFPVAWPRAT
ncbi:MAG: phytanoyl-CoA dioxygenase [Alphaproteobacteria bacterium]|nr:MAG: phytanoyl-CoA dioxygenase [Caulobacteraceae bacterium]TPW05222.1 MAG: phytanoyl-CoA dioxygenase [Alphaproteobacteria bacterium]